MKRGVIINPRSGRRRKGLELAGLLKPHADIAVHVLEEFGSLPSISPPCRRRRSGEIFISSGDGTVQAIQTCLAEGKSSRRCQDSAFCLTAPPT